MRLRAYRTFQALILGGLGIFLFSKILDGRVLLYINQRFVPLVLLGAAGCLILSQALLRARRREDAPGCEADCAPAPDHGAANHNASGWTLWWVALPLLLGLLVPERPLGASALANRAVYTTAPLTARRDDAALLLDLPSQQRTVLDWIRVVNYVPDPSVFSGQDADVTGFVFHDPRLGEGQLLVGRFTITCCVADAMAVGMVVEWTEADLLPENSWVRVQGEIALREFEGQLQVILLADSVEQVPEPVQPYLFP